MDTETEFPITTSTPAVYQVPKLTGDSARKVASLLFHNHHNFNIFWNHKTYHNHQVHYLLTAFALGANPDQLQVAFDVKAGCQRPRWPVDEILISKLSDERYFRSMISQDTYDNWFNDFTAFFQRSSEKEPWPDVVNRYLFSRSKSPSQALILPTKLILDLRCHPSSDPLRLRYRVRVGSGHCRISGHGNLPQQVLWTIFPSSRRAGRRNGKSGCQRRNGSP